MLSLNAFSLPWHIRSPILHRYLEEEWIDLFFKTGGLRLSSFERFGKHTDEQRADKSEGQFILLLRDSNAPPSPKRQMEFALGKTSGNGYVLSTSMIHDPELSESFKTKSYFKIINPTHFAMAVAERIPGFRTGVEGSCLYQKLPIVSREIGSHSVENFKNEKGQIEIDRIFQHIGEHVGLYPYFFKHPKYKHQAEYRFIWKHIGDKQDYIDIEVPGARQFCKRADLHEE